MHRLLIAIACSTALVACGLKGPLYFPEAKPEQPGAPADQQPNPGSVNEQGVKVPGSPLIDE